MARRTSDLMAGDHVRVTYHYPARGMVKAGHDVYEGDIERLYQVPNGDWHVKLGNVTITRTDEDGTHAFDARADQRSCVLVHPVSTSRGTWEVID